MTIFFAGIIFCLSLLGTVKAQDSGTYIDESTVQDSTYVQDIFIADEEPESNHTLFYIGIAVVVIGGGYFLLRKKKK